MKFCIALFSFYLLLLSVAPAAAAMTSGERSSCCEHKTASEANAPLGHQGNDAGCDSVCNPLSSCQCCVIDIAERMSLAFENTPPVRVIISLHAQSAVRTFAACIWQPPRIG